MVPVAGSCFPGQQLAISRAASSTNRVIITAMDAENEEAEEVEVETEILELEDDEQEEEEENESNDNNNNNNNSSRKMGFPYMVLRLSVGLLFLILAFFFLSLFVGFLAAVFSAAYRFSISYHSVSIPYRCRIVSSSVDLRFSKVCKPGLSNHKAKNAFYPFDRSKFRCRYDYYWVSVFEVEYKDHSGSQTQLALSETPTEALPLSCRPNFGVAWLTKAKFQVNETYDCWSTSGISKVSLYPDGFFSCQAKGPSSIEIIRQYFFLSTEFVQSLFIHKNGKSSNWRWETVAGVISGFLTSLISIGFIRILQLMNLWLTKTGAARMVARVVNMVFFKRACFLVAYFSFVGWLMIQFGERVGLPEIYGEYNYQ